MVRSNRRRKAVITETAKMLICTAQMTGRLIVPSLSTMRPQLTGCPLRLSDAHFSLATHYRPTPLRSADIGGEYYFPPAQCLNGLRALWTELVSLDRSGAPPAPLRNCVGRVFSLDFPHRALAIDHGPLFL